MSCIINAQDFGLTDIELQIGEGQTKYLADRLRGQTTDFVFFDEASFVEASFVVNFFRPKVGDLQSR